MKPSDGVRLVFGPFRFDPKSGLLFEDDAEVVLPPRAAAILTSLLQAPGEMVSKEELIAAGWGDTAVSDQSLTEAVKLLRQALRDDPKRPAFIQTLRGRGYRFITPVSAVAKEGPVPREGFTQGEFENPDRKATAEDRAGPATADTGPARGTRLRRRTRRLALGTAALMAVIIAGTFLFWTWLARNTDRLARLEETVDTVVGPGSGVRANRVWADDAELSGSVSPDGKYVAYVGSGSAPQLWLYVTETGRRIQLTRYEPPMAVHREGLAAFSRDGREIAYLVWDLRQDVYEMHVLTLGDADAGGDSGAPGDSESAAGVDYRVVYRGREFVVAHDWTLDGKSVVAALKTKAAVEIVLVPTDAGVDPARPHRIEVLAGDDDQYSNGPHKISLSPDGTTIAYDVAQDEDSGNRDIYTLPLAGGTPVAVVEHELNDHSPLWTPDGQRLIFASNREDDYALWTAPIDASQGAEPVAELETPGHGWNVHLLGLTTAGSLYYGSGYESLGKNIWIAPLEAVTYESAGDPREVLPASPGQHLFPTWSPDGRWLAHVAERGRIFDHEAVVVFNSADERPAGKPRDIYPQLRELRQLQWEPDGNSILARAIGPADLAGIHLIDLAGNVETVIGGVGYPPNINYPRWSPDGDAFFYMRARRERVSNADNGGGRPRVQRILRHELARPETDEDQEIYQAVEPTAIKWVDVSPDGKRIGVYTEAPEGDTYRLTLRIVPLSGNKDGEWVWSRTLSGSEDDWTIAEFAWTPDPDVILYVRRSVGSDLTDDRELWKLDLSSGEHEYIGITMPGIQKIALGPDGRRIAFAASTQEKPSADVWVLSNFLVGAAPANGHR